ncbi:MAG TPA: hypothetical protein VHZ51_02840 [Ktedonobacteraceae bacterium]|jgi:hypothetical protein|nr:hypothetical protein [Ktedonobacteraceae bacterium]
MRKDQLQTMSIAFRQICEGERDWTALGNFMNYWYCYAKDRRPELIADPLPEYDTQSLYQHQWAVFCAASVEWFCDTYDVPCPSWVHDPKYAALVDPWFFDDYEPARSRLRKITPKQFIRRNIFCGNNCYDNKWEFVERMQRFMAERPHVQNATS